jgi:hypothetical protein
MKLNINKEHSQDDSIERESLIRTKQTIPNGDVPINNNGFAISSNYEFTDDLTKHFSLRNAKYITIFLITFFIFYHGYLNSFYGKFI